MKSFLLHLFWICGRLTLLEAARWLLSRLAMAHVDAVANWHGGLHSSLASPVREQLLAERQR